MAQIRILKIASDGVPLEHSYIDEITMASFTVSGGGPVLDGTGLDMNNTPISDVQYLLFNNPATGYINQTAGNLIIDDFMAKERTNVMTVGGEILFPVVTNTSAGLDNFRVPQVAGIPTAAPGNSGEGFMVWDSVNDDLYVWNGTSWDSQSVVEEANQVQNLYTAGETLAAAEVVYISAANTVMKALGDSTSKSFVVGVADAAAASASPVPVVSDGLVAGFSARTAGARQYLSVSVAGALQETAPIGAGNTIVQIGYAKSATEVHLQIQQLGRRS